MLYHDLSWSDAGFETKAVTDGADRASFSGVASTAQRDLARDIIEPGAFGTIVPKKVKLFRDHRPEFLCGGWHRFEQVGKELHVEGAISLLTEKGRETYALMKQGFLDGLSVGFFIAPGGATWDEKRQVRTITKGVLKECSVVALPANDGAMITSVKGLSAADTWQWLRDNGLTDDDIDLALRNLSGNRSRRVNITEIDGFLAKGGDSLDDDDNPFTALASKLKALLHDVRERRAP